MNFVWILLVSLSISFTSLADEASLHENKPENVTSSAQDVTPTSAPENILKTDEEDKIRDQCVVKLRGLPWSVTVDDIYAFFGDCDVKNGKKGIHLMMTTYGRLNGEAFVEMATPEDANKMLKKNSVYWGQRYIEIVSSSGSEMDWMVSRFGTDQEYVRIRGFSRNITEEDVRSFFSGLQIAPNGIIFLTDEQGNKINEAFVRFVDKENAEKAVNKNMEKMGKRFVEVFRSHFAEVYALTGEGTSILHRSRSPDSIQSNSSNDNNAPSASHGGTDQFDGKSEEEDQCVVKLSGLPWSVTADNILSFLGDCKIRGGTQGIHLTMTNLGRPSGMAYVELMTPEDAKKVLEKHHQYMGQRYIIVSPCTRSAMNRAISRNGVDLKDIIDEGTVLIRGIPHGCTKGEIVSFFSGLDIKPNGINFVKNYAGRATGEAYIQFVDKEKVDQALTKHGGKIGFRYIEVFRAPSPDGRSQTRRRERPSYHDRSAPYDRNNRFDGGRFSGYRRNSDWNNYDDDTRWDGPDRMRPSPDNGGYDVNYGNEPRHLVYMRGIPFRAGKDEIAWFFTPLKPINIEIIYDENERPTGRAVVEFASHVEAQEAMRKDKKYIESRFIELRMESFPEYQSNYVEKRGRADMRPDMAHSQGSGPGSWRDDGPRGRDARSYASNSGGGYRPNW